LAVGGRGLCAKRLNPALRRGANAGQRFHAWPTSQPPHVMNGHGGLVPTATRCRLRLDVKRARVWADADPELCREEKGEEGKARSDTKRGERDKGPDEAKRSGE
jgi:hypothetical protein